MKIPNKEWQYLFPALTCTFCFLAIDLLGLVDKTNFSYWSGGLLAQPYRMLTYHFLHGGLYHLLVNICGVIIARDLLRKLGEKTKLFFLIFIGFTIPFQTTLNWIYDILIAKNTMSFIVGFSAILYAIDAFILLSSIFGKKYFLGFTLGLKENEKVRNEILFLTAFGFFYSFAPNVSMIGHLTGFVSGLVLFIIPSSNYFDKLKTRESN